MTSLFSKINMRISCLLLLSLYSHGFAVAADRDLSLDVLGAGPYAVGSTNFTTKTIPLGMDAGRYQEGFNDAGKLGYVNEVLAFEDASFTFQLAVPNDSSKYGASANTTVPYSGYVLYPTTQENTRAGYNVFIPPALPHMQGPADSPIFADESVRYPLVVYSHGVGSHPTANRLSFLIDLASHGYIVMALYHGDGRFAQTEARQFNLRPLAVKTAIDQILAHPDFEGHIDAARIGGAGESFGGATMMALLGAKKVNPDFISIAFGTLITTTVDTRILAASTIVPYAGQGLYSIFGNNGAGAATIDRPFMANSANGDTVTEYSKIQSVIDTIPGVKYLVEYDGEEHSMSDGAFADAYTWTKLFLDAFIKQDATAVEQLSRIRSANGSGKDSLVKVTEPDVTLATEPETAKFENNVLSIPSIFVLDQYYALELNYILGADPIQFVLNSATDIPAQTSTSASFENGVLTVPVVDVGGVNYRVTMTMISESPVQFKLTSAE